LPLKADCIPLIFSDRGGTEGGRKKGIMQTEFCRVLIANQSFFSLLTEVNSAQKSPPLKKKMWLSEISGKNILLLSSTSKHQWQSPRGWYPAEDPEGEQGGEREERTEATPHPKEQLPANLHRKPLARDCFFQDSWELGVGGHKTQVSIKDQPSMRCIIFFC
jgi:hypothetical protein